ncbi:hypothetical protein MHK_001700 [Candidatus Magnetomorum sp. HK-1]|nr:hypothetical protein MHK_001700 [Candidatus Magnetomorum sp. HK-1]
MSRLLDASENHRIRFVSDENCYGITTLYFRAWDQSIGIPGKTADTTDNGATTAFSSETGIATIQIYPVNDFPQMSIFDDLTTFQDSATEPVLLTMTDIETPANQLNIRFESAIHSQVSLLKAKYQIQMLNANFLQALMPAKSITLVNGLFKQNGREQTKL